MRNNIARKLFEGYDNYDYNPEYPNYGSLEELLSSVDDSFNTLMSEDNYSNDDDLINDLTSLAEMDKQMLNANSIDDCLDKNQKDIVYAIVYNDHIHIQDLTDTELADIITEISSQAKLALRDYDL